MSLPSLPELEAASSEESCSGGGPSAPSKSTPTASGYLCSARMMACLSPFLSGQTLEISTPDLGLASWISSLADSRAPISVARGKAPASRESKAASGPRWHGSFARYDRATSSWKTPQCSLFEGLEEFSETWPRWGSMRAGECWERMTWAPRTSASGYGLLPTPSASNYGTNQGGAAGRTGPVRPSLETMARKDMWPTIEMAARWPTPTSSMVTMADMEQARYSGADPGRPSYQDANKEGGALNPEFVEWLMGWPRGWSGMETQYDGRAFDEWLAACGCEWPEEWDVPRVAKGAKDRVQRLKALGNGQVPRCVALAWRILGN